MEIGLPMPLAGVLLLAMIGFEPSAAADEARFGLLPGAPLSLLISYYEQYRNDRDGASFQDRVEARFDERDLRRALRDPDARVREAGAFALGRVGTMASNAALAATLKDPVPRVREIGQEALWAVWFRADSPEHTEQLELVAELIERGRFREAEAMATRLIAAAPEFAEAYNQRAIAAFALGRFADSAADCERVLERNPYHIGALSGLARCRLNLNQPGRALEALKRAAELQPHDLGLKQSIRALEARVR